MSLYLQNALRLFSYHVESYPHSARFKRIVADSAVVLASKETPAVFITSVLKTLKNLCRAAVGVFSFFFHCDSRCSVTSLSLLIGPYLLPASSGRNL